MTPEEQQRRQQAAEKPYISPKWSDQIDDLSKDPNTKDSGLSGPGFYVTTVYSDGHIRRHIFQGRLGSVDLDTVDPNATLELGINKAAEDAFNKNFPPEKAPEVPSSANATTRYVRSNPDGSIMLDESGNPVPGRRDDGTLWPDAIVQTVKPNGEVAGTDVLKPSDQAAAQAAREKANTEHPGYTDREWQIELDRRETIKRQTAAAEANNANDAEKIKIAWEQLGIDRAKLDELKDKPSQSTQSTKDGNWYHLEKDQNGQWRPVKDPDPNVAPKGTADEFGNNLKDLKLGVASQAAQKYQTDLLKRVESTDPNVHISMDDAKKLMDAFIAHADTYLKEQQGILGEQSKIQSQQLTQRQQDLSEVQSRRNFAQQNMDSAVQHSAAVNPYLPAGQAGLAGPAFLGQMMLGNMNAQGVGGFSQVPQIAMTPMQQGIMAIPPNNYAAPAFATPGAAAPTQPPMQPTGIIAP